MADKAPPVPKKKPHVPLFTSKVYRKFETDFPNVPWDAMTTKERDAWIAMSRERSGPPFEIPTGGQEIVKGGLVKKKKKKMRHGGIRTNRPQMMHGGAYKGKKHSYAVGGKVTDMKLGK